MKKVKAFLVKPVWKKVKVWHLLLGFLFLGSQVREGTRASANIEYHNLGGGVGGDYSWLQINPNGTAAIYNSKAKNNKPDGIKSCLANGTWTKVNGKRRLSGFSNPNCPWVSRHNGSEW